MWKTSRGYTEGQHDADRTLLVGGVYGALTEVGAFCAIVFAAVYLATYLFIPPTLEVTSMRPGLLFGYVPLVSLAAVLFPELNPSSPVPVTRFLGWVGLVAVFLILCVMKVFVW